MFISKRDRKTIKVSKSKGKSLTEQSHKKGCDINYLVKRYHQSGSPLPQLTQEQFGEALPVTFHEAMNVVVETQEKFDQLPSEVRAAFDQDPQKLINYVGNGGEVKLLYGDEGADLAQESVAPTEPAPPVEPPANP